MNFDVTGFHPDNALKIALNIFDAKDSIGEKVKALLNNRAIKNLNSVDLPANFKSGKTIDVNLGELLGLGVVTSYYEWSSQQTGTGNTYQAVAGIEDSAKKEIESLLSDGAIWHDQSGKKMVVQQVMTQGYFPRKSITNVDVVSTIKKKMEKRSSYPDNCMLIVNIFGELVGINRLKIYDDIKDLANSFTDVFLVVYDLPFLTMANVNYISEPTARGLTVVLQRHEYEDEWKVNSDGKRYPK